MTSCWTDCSDIVVLVQRDGDADGGQEGHLPQLHGSERGARAVCMCVRGTAGIGPNITLTVEHV
jgi:hypothetical protein